MSNESSSRYEAFDVEAAWDRVSKISVTHTEALRALETEIRASVLSEQQRIEESDDSVGDWQCRDYGDGWITFPDRKAAEKYQEDTGAMMRYRRFYLPQSICPFPIENDDGTQKQCIANKHCGCVHGRTPLPSERNDS